MSDHTDMMLNRAIASADFDAYREDAKDDRIAALEAENAALAQRVTELEAALDKAAAELAAARNNEAVLAARCESMNTVQILLAQQMKAAQDDAARLRAVIEQVTWEHNCPWCGESHGKHSPDCARQAALAQTAQTSEVKA